MAFSFLATFWENSALVWIGVVSAGLAATCAWLGRELVGSRSVAPQVVGVFCWLFYLGSVALWGYLAVAFGLLLGWTVAPWVLVVLALMLVAVVVTTIRPIGGVRLPLILPVGIWIAAVLSGWEREENLLRCDDFLSLRAPVKLVVANPHTASCSPGEVRPSGRFPRTIWQAREGGRVIFSTQGPAVDDGFDGSVCEAHLDGRTAPKCVGPPIGKAQGLIDVPEHKRLLAMQWGIEAEDGGLGAKVFELPRDAGITILAEHWFDEMVGDGFYDPRRSILYMLSARMNGIHRVRLPSFERMETIPSAITSGELRYDRDLGEGVACGQYVGAAIRGAPFRERYMVGSDLSPIERLSMTWGCDWDEVRRKAYIAIPNLALLTRIDYDTGAVEARWLVGPGMRSVEYDDLRRRIYMTDFLRGYVVALDEISGEIVGRWFVGRFSRWVRLTPDGRALLATGNLGIVRIPLDELSS